MFTKIQEATALVKQELSLNTCQRSCQRSCQPSLLIHSSHPDPVAPPRVNPALVQELLNLQEQQSQEIELLKFALQNETRYHAVMQQEIKILERQAHDQASVSVSSTARTRRVPRMKRPEPVSRLRPPLALVSAVASRVHENRVQENTQSHSVAPAVLEEKKQVNSQRLYKKPDFTVSPPKTCIQTTRSGLKAQDRRVDLEDAQGLARADQRLIESFERVLLEKESASVKNPRGRKKPTRVRQFENSSRQMPKTQPPKPALKSFRELLHQAAIRNAQKEQQSRQVHRERSYTTKPALSAKKVKGAPPLAKPLEFNQNLQALLKEKIAAQYRSQEIGDQHNFEISGKEPEKFLETSPPSLIQPEFALKEPLVVEQEEMPVERVSRTVEMVAEGCQTEELVMMDQDNVHFELHMGIESAHSESSLEEEEEQGFACPRSAFEDLENAEPITFLRTQAEVSADNRMPKRPPICLSLSEKQLRQIEQSRRRHVTNLETWIGFVQPTKSASMAPWDILNKYVSKANSQNRFSDELLDQLLDVERARFLEMADEFVESLITDELSIED